jgi:hypothetical protein
MKINENPAPVLNDASHLLHNQLALCGALSETVAAAFKEQESWAARDSAIRMMTRLAGASAAAALAMDRLKGIDFNQTIVIQRIGGREGVPPRIAKTNSGGPA